jgi:hypothetical protein
VELDRARRFACVRLGRWEVVCLFLLSFGNSFPFWYADRGIGLWRAGPLVLRKWKRPGK